MDSLLRDKDSLFSWSPHDCIINIYRCDKCISDFIYPPRCTEFGHANAPRVLEETTIKNTQLQVNQSKEIMQINRRKTHRWTCAKFQMDILKRPQLRQFGYWVHFSRFFSAISAFFRFSFYSLRLNHWKTFESFSFFSEHWPKTCIAPLKPKFCS